MKPPSRAISPAINFQLAGCRHQGCRCRSPAAAQPSKASASFAKLTPAQRSRDFTLKSSTQDDTPPLKKQASDEGEEVPMTGDSKKKSKEFFENLPSFVKGDSVVEGKDIRVIDIGSAIGFACILVYVFRNVLFK
mmetsp:Transcript_22834/g.38170  ORF Transcript_22834/g.38170 Transcript_22834/m.38170 type:complete len:135 (-) Transcript_22834:265-669(-)